MPDFNSLLFFTVFAAVLLLVFVWWRFGFFHALSFLIISGGFTAIMDFISSFEARNYEYPGQSKLWVFSFIFFGWTYICGACMFIAEGILAKKEKDIFSQKDLWWKVPLLTGIISVAMDLFMDPVAVRAGIWVWFIKGTVYYEIPLLNFNGWFILMFCAPLAWIFINRRFQKPFSKISISLLAIIPLMLLSVILTFILNGIVDLLGVK